MIRTQTRTYGVVTPSSRQLSLEAMLRAFAWLVSNVGSMLGTIFNRRRRDWHTDVVGEDQRPKSDDIQEGATALFPPSVRSTGGGGSPRLRGETEGAAATLRELINQDARHKPEHGSVGALEAELQLRILREGGDPILRGAQTRIHGSALTRADQTPAFAGDTAVRSRLKSA